MQAFNTFSTKERLPLIPATGCGASFTAPLIGGVSPIKARFWVHGTFKGGPDNEIGIMVPDNVPDPGQTLHLPTWKGQVPGSFREPIYRISASR